MTTENTKVARSEKPRSDHAIPFSMAMVLVTMGVVYGDIGTSPMYTLRAIMHGNGGLMTMSEDAVVGALSLIIWTMTLITTVKYVLVAMRADNHNEGGIFALYSLVKDHAKWLIIPAMVGGAALLADGILTPAVTVTTAIEGLRTIDVVHRVIGDSQGVVMAITIAIICLLFIVQRAGTSKIGKAFGPIMCLWFGFLGTMGVLNIGLDLSVLRAFNPIHGIVFLFSGEINHAGLMVLGFVFLSTTGAEALYSDMGHVGKANIYASWPVVKACLILNYLGQGAWILAMRDNTELIAMGSAMNPFFEMLNPNLRIFAVLLSTLAAIIASQALITGSFSIVSEAISLDLMPHMKIQHPSQTKGQIYIPVVNAILMVGCVGVVLYFKSSEHMESAYGLAITVTMLMTTCLLTIFLQKNMNKPFLAVPFAIFFGAIEMMFFVSSLTKFTNGGYVTVILALLIFSVMYIWHRGTQIEDSQIVFLPIRKYIAQLCELKDSSDLPYIADNLVFLTKDNSVDNLDRDILYSILDKRPKRARAYWFVNVTVTNEPYTHEYWVQNYGTDFIFRVQLNLGFKVNQRVNEYLYQIVGSMVEQGVLPAQEHRFSIYDNKGKVGDFRFCLVRKVLSPSNQLSEHDTRTLRMKYLIRGIVGNPAQWYGLAESSIIYEYVPLFVATKRQHKLQMVQAPESDEER